MDNTLIVFASDHGSVEKCARQLFRLMGGKVDLCNLSQRPTAPDISSYDSVVIGGSIHSGKIQQSVTGFCEQHLDELASKRLGLFINCLHKGEKAQKQLDDAFPETLSRKAVIRDYFGSEINTSKLNFWERIVTTQMIEKDDLIVALSKEKIEHFAHVMASDDEIQD